MADAMVNPQIQAQWMSNPAWQRILARADELMQSGQPDEFGQMQGPSRSAAFAQALSEAPNAPKPPSGYQIDDRTGQLVPATSNGIDWKNYAKYGAIALGAGAAAGAIPALFAGGAGAGGASGAGAASAGAGAAASAAPTIAATSVVPAGIGGTTATAALGGWLPAINAGAKILGAAGQGAQSAQQNQASYDLTRSQFDNARNQVQQSAVTSDLAQRQYLDNLYAAKAKQAVKGGLLSGIQDYSIAAPAGIPRGTITGGLRPSAITNRVQIGDTMQRNALLELMNPTQPGGIGGTNTGATGSGTLPSIPTLPNLSAAPGGNGLGMGLTIGSDALSAWSLIQDMMNQNKKNVLPLTPQVINPSQYGSVSPNYVPGA